MSEERSKPLDPRSIASSNRPTLLEAQYVFWFDGHTATAISNIRIIERISLFLSNFPEVSQASTRDVVQKEQAWFFYRIFRAIPELWAPITQRVARRDVTSTLLTINKAIASRGDFNDTFIDRAHNSSFVPQLDLLDRGCTFPREN